MSQVHSHTLSPLTRLFYAVAWVGILTGLAVTLTLGYWKLAPYSGLTDVPQPFPIEQSVARKGQLVTYTMSYCVDASLPLPITVHRSLELQNGDPDAPLGSLPIAPPIEYEITQRCETRDFFVGLPMYVPAGRYHIHTHTTLQVNPIRQIRQAWVSAEFDVLPALVAHDQTAIDEPVALPSPKEAPYVPRKR